MFARTLSLSTQASELGAILFRRCVSGTRIVTRGATKQIGAFGFVGYGASHSAYPHVYMTAACAMGMDQEDIDLFLKRLDKALTLYKKNQAKKKKRRLKDKASKQKQQASGQAEVAAAAGANNEGDTKGAGGEEA